MSLCFKHDLKAINGLPRFGKGGGKMIMLIKEKGPSPPTHVSHEGLSYRDTLGIILKLCKSEVEWTSDSGTV